MSFHHATPGNLGKQSSFWLSALLASEEAFEWLRFGGRRGGTLSWKLQYLRSPGLLKFLWEHFYKQEPGDCEITRVYMLLLFPINRVVLGTLEISVGITAKIIWEI